MTTSRAHGGVNPSDAKAATYDRSSNKSNLQGFLAAASPPRGQLQQQAGALAAAGDQRVALRGLTCDVTTRLVATPRLIVAGNCQARFLANLLSASPKARERYVVVYFRNFRSGDQGELHERTLRNCGVLLEQIAHQAPELPHKALLPKWTRIIRFPILWFNGLWPTYVRDPRNPPKGAGPQPWPYGDRVILKALDNGLTAEEAVEAWFAADVPALLDVDRFQEINAMKMRALDERADIKLAGYLLENFQTERLFVTHNHPSPETLAILGDRVFEAIGLGAVDVNTADAAGGMFHTHVPIQSSVARHFGLQWWTPDLPGRLRDIPITAEEYWRRYSRFEPMGDAGELDLETD